MVVIGISKYKGLGIICFLVMQIGLVEVGFMTKENFLSLQQKRQENGLNLTAYLKQISQPYSNYCKAPIKFIISNDGNMSIMPLITGIRQT
jgi:hypothetical protein